MKTYRGRRTRAGFLVVDVEDESGRRRLHHVVAHSPAGIECGYHGSGPADLALSLASDVIGTEEETVAIAGGWAVGSRAYHVHQEVKRRLVANLPRGGWTVTEDDVRAAMGEEDQ